LPDRIVVGVVADTHLPRFGTRLPRALVEGLVTARVERILHAGDHTTELAVELLTEIAPVDAVAGNNDGEELVALFGTDRRIEVGGLRIGLTHGHLGRGATTPDRAALRFEPGTVDLVVFGHSHRPSWRPAANGRPALLNPGSPTDRRREAAFSFAIVEITPGDPLAFDVRLERFADRRT
jgi:putative phosphoesterase